MKLSLKIPLRAWRSKGLARNQALLYIGNPALEA